mmetsp:Transcript_26464/g.87598  ORF Transcript_26464/g.87598 Transcript_26464/m.87598 type:complete len:202 (+) Transcript_26464:79-684(+)
MGNDVSKNMANRMAIGAMSNVTDVEKAQLIKLCFNLKDIGKRQGNPNIVTKEEFHEAFQGVDVSQSDRDVFDRLFVMLDRTGEDRINHKEFMMGVCPFISGTTLAVLQLAFELYEDASDNIKYSDLRFILMTINTVASYFGDPVMRTDQVDELVDAAAEKLDLPPKSGTLVMADLAPFVAGHDLVTDFIEGRGTSRYGNKL